MSRHPHRLLCFSRTERVGFNYRSWRAAARICGRRKCSYYDGTFATIQPGSLLVLDRNAKIVLTLTKKDLLDSPWDLTVQDEGDVAKVFVSNVVSGTVTRLDLAIMNGKPVVMSTTLMAKGYMVQANAAAVILGPTGVAYDADKDILYVASTADNTDRFLRKNATGAA